MLSNPITANTPHPVTSSFGFRSTVSFEHKFEHKYRVAVHTCNDTADVMINHRQHVLRLRGYLSYSSARFLSLCGHAYWHFKRDSDRKTVSDPCGALRERPRATLLL
jgi:hypothetical protein